MLRRRVRPYALMRVFEKARVVFDTYCGMDKPKLPEGSLQALQVQLHRALYIRDQVSRDSIVCCLPSLIRAQGDGAREVVSQAVRRILVHLVNLCTSYRLDFGTLLEEGLKDVIEKGKIE